MRRTARLLTIALTVILMLGLCTVSANASSKFSYAVSGFKVVSADYDSVKVSWKAKKGALGYEVYQYNTETAEYDLIAEMDKNTRSLIVDNLHIGIKYTFKVRAWKGEEDDKVFNKYTKGKSAKPALKKPALVSVKATSCREADISWENVNGAEGFELYRCKHARGKYVLVASGCSDTTSYHEDNLLAGKKYYYKIRQFRTVGDKVYYSSTSKYKYSSTMKTADGNASKYALTYVKYQGASSLTGKKIFFLGSSVTQGLKSGNVSFVDYLAKRNKCTAYKEAVAGTTLAKTATSNGTDYVSRMLKNKKFKTYKPDMFVCQLSYNDVVNDCPVGELTEENVRDCSEFDTSTTMGAIEYIISYAQKWECPVVFYTVVQPPNRYVKYDELVDILTSQEMADKWGISVINLWDGLPLPEDYLTDSKTYRTWMYDNLHPTKAGYLKWWIPFMEPQFQQIMTDFLYVPEPEEIIEEIEEITEENTEGTPEEENLQNEEGIPSDGEANNYI